MPFRVIIPNPSNAPKVPVPSENPTDTTNRSIGDYAGDLMGKAWDYTTPQGLYARIKGAPGADQINADGERLAKSTAQTVTEGLNQEGSQNGLDRLWNVGKTAIQGGIKTAQGLGQLGYDATGESALNPFDKRTINEKAQSASEGLNNVASGLGQMATAPFEMSPLTKGLIGLPFQYLDQKIQDGLLDVGVDPNSKHGQDARSSIMNALNAGVIATGMYHKGWGGLDEQGKPLPITPEGAGQAIGDTVQGINDLMDSTGNGLSKYAAKKLGATGLALYESTQPPTTREAELMQKQDAGTLPKDMEIRTKAMSGIDNNVVGSQKTVGVRAETAANKVWTETVQPALDANDTLISKADGFKQLQDFVDSQEGGRRLELQKGLNALKKDYLDPKYDHMNLALGQKVKATLDEFTPSKMFRGEDVQAPYTQMKNEFADYLRQNIHDALPDDVSQAYYDYGNLKDLSKSGVAARIQSGQKGGFGGFTGEAKKYFTAPVTTRLGAYLYKLAQSIGKNVSPEDGQMGSAGGGSLNPFSPGLEPVPVPSGEGMSVNPVKIGLEEPLTQAVAGDKANPIATNELQAAQNNLDSNWTPGKANELTSMQNESVGKANLSLGKTTTPNDVIQYHGSQNAQAVKNAITNGTLDSGAKGVLGKGFYVTTSPEVAKFFGSETATVDGNGMQLYRETTHNPVDVIPIDMTNLKIKTLPYGKADFYDFIKKEGFNDVTPYTNSLKESGFDGLKLTGAGQTVIWNTKAIRLPESSLGK